LTALRVNLASCACQTLDMEVHEPLQSVRGQDADVIETLAQHRSGESFDERVFPHVKTVLRWLAAATLLLTCGCRGREQPSAVAAGDLLQQSALDTARLPRTNVTVADRARWLTRLRWPHDCEEAFTQTHLADDGGLDFYEIEPGVSIVVVRCALGAYQPTQVVRRVDERPVPAGGDCLRLRVV
jgi:hypothetical protein